MREHQIVITLKPEQFLKVQRLAKDAGAKSMGIFVRTKLLYALGIEGTSDDPARHGSEDITLQVTELKRLHAELRGFVAESLALYQTDLEDSDFAAPQVIPEGEQHERDDDLEKLADRTFAISPRLGAVESQRSNDEFRDPLSDLLADVSIPEGKAAEEEEVHHVPLAIRERRRQLAEEKPEEKAEDKPTLEDDKLPPRQRHTRHTKEAEEEIRLEAKQEEQKEQNSQDQPPPLSGSPPPKRKKT